MATTTQRSRFWAFTIANVTRQKELDSLLMLDPLKRTTRFKAYRYYYDTAKSQITGLVRTRLPIDETKIVRRLPPDAKFTLVVSLLAARRYDQLVRDNAAYECWHHGTFVKALPVYNSTEQSVYYIRSTCAEPSTSLCKAILTNQHVLDLQKNWNATARVLRSSFWAIVLKNVPLTRMSKCRDQLLGYAGPDGSSAKFLAYYCYYDPHAQAIQGLVRTASRLDDTKMRHLLPDNAAYWPVSYLHAQEYREKLMGTREALGTYSFSAGSFARKSTVEFRRAQVARRPYSDVASTTDAVSHLEAQAPPAKRVSPFS